MRNVRKERRDYKNELAVLDCLYEILDYQLVEDYIGKIKGIKGYQLKELLKRIDSKIDNKKHVLDNQEYSARVITPEMLEINDKDVNVFNKLKKVLEKKNA